MLNKITQINVYLIQNATLLSEASYNVVCVKVKEFQLSTIFMKFKYRHEILEKVTFSSIGFFVSQSL